MCGRYNVSLTGRDLANSLGAELRADSAPPCYNRAPSQHSPVLVQDEGRLCLDMFRWGLIPFWAKDPGIGNRMINARAETLDSKPAFRNAFRRRRCLVPASGFYEWRKTRDGKVPHWIHPADGAPLTFAGLWEEWSPGADLEPIHSFTIITLGANEFMKQIHDRMPAIIPPEGRGAWLNPQAESEDLANLLRAAPEDLLEAHPISTRVNSPANDDPTLIDPINVFEQGSMF